MLLHEGYIFSKRRIDFMKKIYHLAIFLSSGFIFSHHITLPAAQPMITSPSRSSNVQERGSLNTPSTPTTSEVKKGGAQTEVSPSKETNQDEMAAWMLESARAAKDYVDDLDKGQYAESWTKSDEIFKNTLTQSEWVTLLNAVRKDLGKVHSRTIRLHSPVWNPLKMPPGLYMVIDYDTSFENAPRSSELLILRRGADGQWRVLSYFVKPGNGKGIKN
jgi:Protein of unknown function (DUF4019)